jgi:hypothetical protein
MSKVNEALARGRERLEIARLEAKQQIQYLRDNAPSLTTGLLILVLLVGAGAGFHAGKWWVRASVNAEWRDRIAAKSASVRAIVARGNADADAVDTEIINALGDNDAKLANAERHLKTISSRPIDQRCSIPADCLRRQ